MTNYPVGFFAGNWHYWAIFFVTIIASYLVNHFLQSAIKRYSKIPTVGNITGKEVAEKMLKDNDIYDVKVVCIPGRLTDNYNPTDKTLNLSSEIYRGASIASAAVTAHECGHAIQHATSYSWLQMRSKLVSVVSFTNKWLCWLLCAGMFFVGIFPQLLLAGIILFAITALFSLITLPVEINASQRALVWLNRNEITTPETHPKAQKALRMAAYTYVVAAVTSTVDLLYYIQYYLRRL